MFFEHRDALLQLHIPQTDLPVEAARHEPPRVVLEADGCDRRRVARENEAVEVVPELFVDRLLALCSCVLVFSVALVLLDPHPLGVLFVALRGLLQEDAGDLSFGGADQDHFHQRVRFDDGHQSVEVVDADLQHVRLRLLGGLASGVADELLREFRFEAERLSGARKLLLPLHFAQLVHLRQPLAQRELGLFAQVDLARGLLDQPRPVLVLSGVESDEQLARVDLRDLFAAHPGEQKGRLRAGSAAGYSSDCASFLIRMSGEAGLNRKSLSRLLFSLSMNVIMTS